ncbi:MAG: hypothetical protein ABI230_10745 [Aestuariivirga sp.]
MRTNVARTKEERKLALENQNALVQSCRVVNNLKGGDPMSSEFNLMKAFAMRIAGSAGAASH